MPDLLHAPAWIALVVGLAATALVRAVSLRHGWVERPGVRRVHSGVLPRTGGLAVLAALAAGVAAGVLLGAPIDTPLVALLFVTVPVFAVGWIDDVRGAGARAKLLAQTGAALALCAAGVRLDAVPLPGGGALELGALAWPVTVLWLVGISNALNLIDGSDGVAAVLAVVAAALASGVAFLGGDVATGWVAAVVAGAAGAFLVHNAHPATIHLGDGGSLALGFLLAGLAVVGGAREAATVSAVAAPALALAVPAVDLVLCVVRRRLVGRSIVAPDTAHVHHHLLAEGHSPRGVAVAIGVVAAAAGLLGAATVAFPARDGLLLLGGVLLVAWFFARVGHFRLRPLLAARRRRRAVDTLHRDLQKQFEHLQLVLWNAGDFESWWTVVERAARSLGLESARAEVTLRSGARVERRWTRPGGATPPAVTAVIAPRPPDGVASITLECALAEGGPIESAGERLARFARLLEEERPDWAEHRVEPLPNETSPGRRPLRGVVPWGREALEEGPYRDR